MIMMMIMFVDADGGLFYDAFAINQKRVLFVCGNFERLTLSINISNI